MFRITVSEQGQATREQNVANLGQAEYLASSVIQAYGREGRQAIRGDNCGGQYPAEYLQGWDIIVTVGPA